MFIGHFAVGMAAKRFAPKASLGSLFFAAQFLDLLWPVFVLLGWESVAVDHGATAFTPLNFVSYPYSHSLLMTLFWSGLVFTVYLLATSRMREAMALGVLVLSHWVLDWISHRRDLPLILFSDVKVGLGLWQSVPSTLLVEILMFGAGLVLYLQTVPRRQSSQLFWALVLLLLGIYFMSAFGPKPPENSPPSWIATPVLGMWIFVAWAAWVDSD